MKRSALPLALLVLALAGCSDGAATSGDSNTDSQVVQPPTPDQSDGGVPQGAAPSPTR